MIAPVATDSTYLSGGTVTLTTSYTYMFYSGGVQPSLMVETYPDVTTGQNGSGTSPVSSTAFDMVGREIWTQDALGYLGYTGYDPQSGSVILSIADVNLTTEPGFSDAGYTTDLLPSGWTTPSGGGLNARTISVVDALGRDIEVTDPDGNVTFTVFNDADHEVTTYAGWQSGTDQTTGPIERTQWFATSGGVSGGGYTDSLGYYSNTIPSSGGMPLGTETITSIVSLSEDFDNPSGQSTQSLVYFDVTGLSYSAGTPAPGSIGSMSGGTLVGNYYSTTYVYGSNGAQCLVTDPSETMTQTTEDLLGRVTSTWIGTSLPSGGEDYWTTSNPGNFEEVSSSVYGSGGESPELLTESYKYPGSGGGTPETTIYAYDWRNRQVATLVSGDSTVNGQATFVTLDDQGRTTEMDVYSVPYSTSIISGGLALAPSSTYLVSKEVDSIDNEGQVYQTEDYVYDIFTSSMSSTPTVTENYYDLDNNLIATFTPGQLWEKTSYNGLMQATATYETSGTGTGYSYASSITGDTVYQQSVTTFDLNGNPTEIVTSARLPGAGGTGALTTSNAWVTYGFDYYDALGRPTVSVNFGTNGGSAPMWYSDPTDYISGWRSDNDMVTEDAYDSIALNTLLVTGPDNVPDETVYNADGTTNSTVQNYFDGPLSGGSDPTLDLTTTYGYNAGGNQASMTVTGVNIPSGGETTTWNYGITTSQGSTYYSNDVVYQITTPGGTQTYTYNALGQTLTYTDANGTEHTYSYNILGMQTLDSVTSGGSGIDDTIKSIGTSYDNMWNVSTVTSYTTTSPNVDDVANQVVNITDGSGNLVSQTESAVSGGMVISGGSEVSYGYAPTVSGGAEQLAYVEYPDLQVYDYVYAVSGGYASGGDSGGVAIFTFASGGVVGGGVPIGMMEAIEDPSLAGDDTGLDGLNQAVVEAYTDLGNGTEVAAQSAYGPGWTLMSGGAVIGLNQFGETSEIEWIGSGGAIVQNLIYTYTIDGQVASVWNTVNPTQSKIYTYNALNQLLTVDEGTMNSDGTAFSGGTTYTLTTLTRDSVGNILSVSTASGTVGGSTPTPTTIPWTANNQNETTSINSSPLYYNSGGENTTDSAGDTLTYDAWGRLVSVYSGETLVASYTYNGLNEQVTELIGSTDVTTTYIYSAGAQVVEEVVSGTVVTQNLWGGDGNLAEFMNWTGSAYEILWVQVDTSGSVISVCLQGDTLGSSTMVEYYDYSWSGVQTIYNSGGTPISVSAFGEPVGYKSQPQDIATGFLFTPFGVYNPADQQFINAFAPEQLPMPREVELAPMPREVEQLPMPKLSGAYPTDKPELVKEGNIAGSNGFNDGYINPGFYPNLGPGATKDNIYNEYEIIIPIAGNNVKSTVTVTQQIKIMSCDPAAALNQLASALGIQVKNVKTGEWYLVKGLGVQNNKANKTTILNKLTAPKGIKGVVLTKTTISGGKYSVNSYTIVCTWTFNNLKTGLGDAPDPTDPANNSVKQTWSGPTNQLPAEYQ